ncbi:hypothetical protein [Desulfosarcina ovata]|uniref:hypothetical protein n=1 Tax=Desulfosarcina ovata TaxID=83564 RepID=UPI0012D2B17D|nr:hypothetical protein [Desulfosarcina ovata]
MQFCYNNPKRWLPIFCQGTDCKSLYLADLIALFQEGSIKDGDREKLLQCLICNSDFVWKKWKSIVSIYSEYENHNLKKKSKDLLQDALQEFLFNCLQEAKKTVIWFKFEEMKSHKNDDFFRVFNNQMGYRLRGRRIKFVKEQVVSVSAFIDTASELDVLSTDEIEAIEALPSEEKKALNIIKILNNKILKDLKFYSRTEGYLSKKNTEFDDFTKDLLIKIKNIKEIELETRVQFLIDEIKTLSDKQRKARLILEILNEIIINNELSAIVTENFDFTKDLSPQTEEWKNKIWVEVYLSLKDTEIDDFTKDLLIKIKNIKEIGTRVRFLIEEIKDLSGEQREARLILERLILDILNEKIVEDEKSYIRIKDKLSVIDTEFYGFTNDLLERLKNSKKEIEFKIRVRFPSVSFFIDMAKVHDILSANEIDEIAGLSGEQRKANRIVIILNEKILNDKNFYIRIKDKLSVIDTEFDDFTEDLLLQMVQWENKFQTFFRPLNERLILEIFDKSVIGLKDLWGIDTGANGIDLDPKIPEASSKLFTILCLLEDGAFLKENQADVDDEISFLRCLLIEYGQRYRFGEFVLESIMEGNAKTTRARRQKARFVDRIKPDVEDGDIDKNHFIFKNCHGHPYTDLLCADEGPAFIVNGIEKALHFKCIELTQHDLEQTR